jgi:hypothetical protein
LAMSSGPKGCDRGRGTSIAKGDGAVGHRGGLVGFGGEHGFALPAPNGSSDRPPAAYRIAADRGALVGQKGQARLADVADDAALRDGLAVVDRFGLARGGRV